MIDDTCTKPWSFLLIPEDTYQKYTASWRSVADLGGTGYTEQRRGNTLSSEHRWSRKNLMTCQYDYGFRHINDFPEPKPEL